MILLSEVATKLQNILNGLDSETMSYTRPNDFQFVVATQGFHLDKILDRQTGKNFVPVFISTVGGEYDPVVDIRRVSYTIPISIYFPVRFKNDFFAMNDFLVDCFVGKILNYGSVSKLCLSNISVSNYGEIQDLDLRQFQTWVTNIYQTEIDIREPFMSMSFNLYLTNSNTGYLYGNQVDYTLSYKYNGTTYTEKLAWTQSGTGISNSPIAQQLIGVDNYAKNTINFTSRSQSIVAYVKDNTFWNTLVNLYNSGTLNSITDLTLTKTYNFSTPATYTYNSLVLAMNENVQLGELLSFTISFGDRI